MIVLDIRDEFDRLAWQIAQPIQSAPTVLVTWTVTPEPVDAGMPMRVAEPFSDALAALGPVLFAGDPDIKRALQQPARSHFDAVCAAMTSFCSGPARVRRCYQPSAAAGMTGPWARSGWS